jgi:hypothetical protein
VTAGTDLVAGARPTHGDDEVPRGDGRVRSRAVQLLLAVLAGAGLTVIELFRASGPSASRTIWAEDGPVFLFGALHDVSIFETHAGYGQLASRLVGWGAAQVSLPDASVWLAVVPSVLTALLALTAYWLSDFLVMSRALRAVLAASFVLPAVLVSETLANAANLQWPLLATCFWALIRPLTSWRHGVACGLVVVITALSSSVAFVFVPLAVLVVVVRKSRVGSAIPALFVAGCAGQAWLSLDATESAARGASRLGDLPTLFTVRVAGNATIGERLLEHAWVSLGVGLAIILGALFLAAIVTLFRKNDHGGRLWGCTAIVMSVVLFCATTYYRGTRPLRLIEGEWHPGGGRYVGCALQLLVAGMVILLARARLAPQWRRALVVVVVAHAIVVPAISWRPLNGRSQGPTWKASLTISRAACVADPTLAEVQTPTTPPGWYVGVPCSELR